MTANSKHQTLVKALLTSCSACIIAAFFSSAPAKAATCCPESIQTPAPLTKGPAPVLIAPKMNETCNTKTPAFVWTNVLNALFYAIYIQGRDTQNSQQMNFQFQFSPQQAHCDAAKCYFSNFAITGAKTIMWRIQAFAPMSGGVLSSEISEFKIP